MKGPLVTPSSFSFKIDMQAKAWAVVGPHGYQDDPQTCEVCRIRERVRDTRRADGRSEIVTVVFDGPRARDAACWVLEQLNDAQFERIDKRTARIVEVEHALLLARCFSAGWLEWTEEPTEAPA